MALAMWMIRREENRGKKKKKIAEDVGFRGEEKRGCSWYGIHSLAKGTDILG